MKIRYISDLHLEFIKPHNLNKFIHRILPTNHEICILAGDIGNPYQEHYDIFMTFISLHFEKAFVISGNHEYYNKTKSIQETNDFLIHYFKKFNNITFLNNTFEYYQDYCFVGTTLWSNITNPIYQINDINYIPDFTITQYNQLNQDCIQFLNDTLQNHNNCIIITHHLPSESFIDNKYKTKQLTPYNQWFYSDLDHFIEKYKDNIKSWFYGHTHTSSTIIKHNIHFLCNPIGYPNENNKLNFHTSIDSNEFL